MADTLPESIEPYENISSKAYEHPADRAATAALKAVPMLDTVVRKLVEWRYERALRQFYLGNSVKVGEHQLPDLWASHRGVCRILDMRRYDLYVELGRARRRPGGRLEQADGRGRLAAAAVARPRRAARGPRPRARPHPVRSRHVHDRAQHPAERRRPAAVLPRDPVPGRPRGAARVVPRGRAQLRPRRDARGPRSPDRLPHADGDRRRGMPADRLNLDAFMAQAMEYEAWDDP